MFLCQIIYAVIPYKTYSISDGLPNSTIKAICQDSLGYIWFGTRSGLVRFDGYEFRTYNYIVQKENTTNNNDITCLTGDSKGLIWIGTFNWITLFNPFTEKFVEMDLKCVNGNFPKGVVTKIWIDKTDKVWVSSKTGLYVIQDSEVSVIESFRGACINSMGNCDDENLLLDVMGKGIALFNIHSRQYEYINDDNVGKRLYKILKDSKGQVWLGADESSLFLYQPEYKLITPVKINVPDGLKLNNGQIHDMLEYNDSTLILGTDNGLLAINLNYPTDTKNANTYLQTDNLANYRIMSLFKDNQGALWVGTFNKGLKYCDPNRYYFNYYDLNVDKKIPSGVIGNLTEENDHLWFGNEWELCNMDMTTGVFSHINLQSLLSAPNERLEPFFVYKGFSRLLYFYLLNRGIYEFDLNKRQVNKPIKLPPASQIRSMMKDGVGNIWIAGEELSIYNPVTGELNSNLPTNFNNTTSFMLSQDLLMMKNGDMLVGTRTSGVWRYRYDEHAENKYQNVEKLDIEQLKDKNVNVLFEDSKENIWVGAYSSGLFRCNPENKTCTVYDTNNGLGHNTICGILENENNGDIWIATLSGISKLNPETGRIVNYTGKTGFPLEEVSRKAFLKGSNGLFYVGGSNGLVSFDPNVFKDEVLPPPAVRISLIESLNAKGNKGQMCFDNLFDLKKVELPFNQSSIIIKFSSLNYFYPQGNKYAYKLDGLEKEWKFTERNEVVYSNLNAGEYVFCVKTTGSDGICSENATTVKIKILPPLWGTLGAKIIYVLIVSLLFYFVIQFFYNKKTSKYKQQINQIEKDNIEKYYQMKLELFTKFSHELRTPLTLITGPVEDILNEVSLPEKFKYPVRLIQKNANKLLLLVNQLMDFRKLEQGAMKLKIKQIDLDAFLSEQVENFSGMAKKKNIAIAYLSHYWEKDLWFDEELMEKVLFNLISNAVKHSHEGGEIIITSTKKDETIVISVSDNGEGIAPENLEKIFNPFFQVHHRTHAGMFGSGIGLNLAKYIVNLHDGNIFVESVIGKGSKFSVQIPLGTKHFDMKNTEIVIQSEDDNLNRLLEKQSVSPIDEGGETDKMNEKNVPLILVVEDDDDLSQYIISNLSNNYAVVKATDGKEALSLALEKIPDLVVSDVMMPVMDGIELCKHLKEDMRTAHIPVILLTARIMKEYIKEGYEALADDYILKPFDSDLLKIRIQSMIQNRIQLRKNFSSKLSSIDTPTIELTRNNQFMKKLIDIIEKHIDDSQLSINVLSVTMGLSRAQLFRKIKAISDISPNKLILNIRMKMAADFLQTKQFTISEVAYKVGFSDPTYFSKSFKSVFNITPSKFVNDQIQVGCLK